MPIGHGGDLERVYCEFKYSRAAFGFMGAAVGGTLAIVVLVPFPDAIRAAAFAVVVGLAWHAWGKISRTRAIELDCRGGFALLDAACGWREGTLRGDCFIAPWLTVIRWRPHAGRFDRTVLLLPDMADEETRRRIRVLLRHV